MQENIKGQWFLLFLRLITDALFIVISFLLAYFVKFRSLNIGSLPINIYFKILIFVTLIWLIILNLGGLYKFTKKDEKKADNLLATSFAITSAAFITLLIILFLYKEAIYAKDIIFYAWLISLVLLNVSRWVIWRIYQISNL